LALAFVCASAFALFVSDARRPITASTGELRIWLLDVGQGDAIFIETPGHSQILVDGGPDDAVLVKLGELMPPTDRTLEGLVSTHPDADHVSGLVSVLDRYDVTTIFETGLTKDTKVARAYAEAVMSEAAERRAVKAGDRFSYDGVEFHVLWPDARYDGKGVSEPNRAGIVLLVRYGETSVLLTADTEAKEEASYGARAGDVDVLKAGHHGSRTSSSRPFLLSVTPEFAVISCGEDNRYGHPHEDVLARFADLGIRVFRTDQHGEILIRSGGGEPTVEPAPLPF